MKGKGMREKDVGHVKQRKDAENFCSVILVKNIQSTRIEGGEDI